MDFVTPRMSNLHASPTQWAGSESREVVLEKKLTIILLKSKHIQLSQDTRIFRLWI